MAEPEREPVTRTVFRLPRTTYLVVLFLLIGALPFVLGPGVGTAGHPSSSRLSPWVLMLAVPLAAAAFVYRTATIVDEDGITVRLVLGSRHLRWSELQGVAVRGAAVYAVYTAEADADGSWVRLPCVTQRSLSAFTAASDGRLPAVRPPAIKLPPGTRRRR